MTGRKINLNVLRLLVEIVALIFVAFLVRNGKLQLWLAVFVIGLIVSIFAGRFFCGWLCPMNTLFRPINFVYSKLKIKRLQTPAFLRSNTFRVIFLILFFGMLISIKIMGFKVNMLLYLIILSVIVTLIYQEEFWHRHLCPFGTILSFTSRKGRQTLFINEEGCISCGKCQKVCPSFSIETLENKKRRNKSNECLLCLQCIDVCPVDVCQMKVTKRGAKNNSI